MPLRGRQEAQRTSGGQIAALPLLVRPYLGAQGLYVKVASQPIEARVEQLEVEIGGAHRKVRRSDGVSVVITCLGHRAGGDVA